MLPSGGRCDSIAFPSRSPGPGEEADLTRLILIAGTVLHPFVLEVVMFQ